jgi:hypothetical protein
MDVVKGGHAGYFKYTGTAIIINPGRIKMLRSERG